MFNQVELPAVAELTQRLLLDCRRHILDALAGAPMNAILGQFFARGKMLRAELVFLSASAVGGAASDAMPAAIGIELLHGASLIHDDIIDDAFERRGVAALHRQVGTEIALTLGDYLVFRAFSELAKASASHPPERVLTVLRGFSLFGQRCCEGQIIDIADRTKSEDAYAAMVDGKTGSLFAAATSSGATLGGGSPEQVASLRTFGECLGGAFQVCDDIDEFVWQDGSAVKANGHAPAQPSASLPFILLTKYGSAGALDEYARLSGIGKHREISALLDREGIWTRISAAQDVQICAAVDAIGGLEHSEAKLTLRAIAEACRPLAKDARSAFRA